MKCTFIEDVLDCRERGEGKEVTAGQKWDGEVREEAERERICHHVSQHHVVSRLPSLAVCCMADNDRLSC